MKRTFNRVSTPDRILETIQTNVDLVLQSIQSAIELNPVYVEATVSSGDNVIKHSLGRPFKYWELVGTDNYVGLKLSSTTNNSRHQQIILTANANANITIRLT